MLLVFMPAFWGSSISVGRLFLNSGVLSEEALPPAVASLNVCSRVACVCLYLSLCLSPLHHFLFSSSLIPSAQQRVPSVLIVSRSVPFVYFFLKSCLCLSLLCVSLFLTLHLSLAPVLSLSFCLSLSLSHRPLLPLTDSVIN